MKTAEEREKRLKLEFCSMGCAKQMLLTLLYENFFSNGSVRSIKWYSLYNGIVYIVSSILPDDVVSHRF